MELKNIHELLKQFRASDLRGLSQISVEAFIAATHISEGVHQSVWRTIGAKKDESEGKTNGITRIAYNGIYGITSMIGLGTDALLKTLQPIFDSIDKDKPNNRVRETVVAALNGVMGDRLVKSDNPLATPMSLYYQGSALRPELFSDLQKMPSSKPSSKVLLMIHGLCMNDMQWSGKYQETAVNHGETLAAQLGYTPVYLRYNSGQHISKNGKELSHKLEQLMSDWPESVDEIAVLAHSMGGLVMRSACHYGEKQQHRWLNRLNKIVYLGTPHHGAPLAKSGGKVEFILNKSPYTTPFVKLANLRSAGIDDLRYGYLLDDDWLDEKRRPYKWSDCGKNEHEHLPLPKKVDHYCIAATLASRRLKNDQIGDGLVPLDSALGINKDNSRTLKFLPSSQWIAHGVDHMDLLTHPEITRRIIHWFSS